MFWLTSTIPAVDKDNLWKSEPKSSICIENLTQVPLKLEKPENCRFCDMFFSTQHYISSFVL